MTEQRKSEGEGTKLLKSIDVWENKIPPRLRAALKWLGAAMIATTVARFILKDVIGGHDHASEGWLDAARVLLLELGGSIVMLVIGISILIPPIGVKILTTILGFVRKKGRLS